MKRCAIVLVLFGTLVRLPAQELRVATFEVDVTPPLGSPLCHGAVLPARKIVDRLTARGLVLLGAGDPIVLCAVDWVGIGNGGHDAWRRSLAHAVRTTPSRVAVHTVHQHDAPGCDFETEELLIAHELGGSMFPAEFARLTIARAAMAAGTCVQRARRVTHLGLGRARVVQVASNRRILGPDGTVRHVRFSKCTVAAAIAAPEGTIDPWLRAVSLWDGDRVLAVLTYYATHPQSFYGAGGVSADFVGMARAQRERELPIAAHIHFNGAGGNVAAGKYNDGSPPNRPVLAGRLATGMRAAFEATARQPLGADEVRWKVQSVRLPAAAGLQAEDLLTTLRSPEATLRNRIAAARDLTWLARVHAETPIELHCLELAGARLLHMPGELFVEYQLAAQDMAPDAFVAMAAYGDYGPGYIGTAIAYGQGGYETGPPSRVAPAVEDVLIGALQTLSR